MTTRYKNGKPKSVKENVLYQSKDPVVLEKASRLKIEDPVDTVQKMIDEDLENSKKEMSFNFKVTKKTKKNNQQKANFFIENDDIFLTAGPSVERKRPFEADIDDKKPEARSLEEEINDPILTPDINAKGEEDRDVESIYDIFNDLDKNEKNEDKIFGDGHDQLKTERKSLDNPKAKNLNLSVKIRMKI